MDVCYALHNLLFPLNYIYIPTLFYFYYLDIGAAYGTAKSGVGIASMGVMHPGLVMKNIIPVVMAGVLGIYGLIVAVIIQGSSKYKYSVMDSNDDYYIIYRCIHDSQSSLVRWNHKVLKLYWLCSSVSWFMLWS